MTTHARHAHHDTTVVKIDSTRSPHGSEGEKYLASGVRTSMRLWENEPAGETAPSERDYETVGYVMAGRAELHVEGQLVLLEQGDSYVVPPGARHHYRILEPLTAVEATSPPAQVHGRDERRHARDEPSHAPRDDAREIVAELERRAKLPPGTSAGDAVSAVMCALADRLGACDAEGILLDLPPRVRSLVERCVIHTDDRAAVFDREELLERVTVHLGTEPSATAAITRAVFAAVRRVLPGHDVRGVASQLPGDVVQLWRSG